MRVWQYVEAHHKDFGVALFIIPMLLLALAVVAFCSGIAWLRH